MYQLDLHGVKHVAVHDKVMVFLSMAETPCSIITGNSNAMKEIVFKYLDKHEYKYCVYSYNLGEVIVF